MPPAAYDIASALRRRNLRDVHRVHAEMSGPSRIEKEAAELLLSQGGPVFFRCSVHDLSGVQYSRGCLSYHEYGRQLLFAL